MPIRLNPLQGDLLKRIDSFGETNTQMLFEWVGKSATKCSEINVEFVEKALRELVGKRLLNGTITREVINGVEVPVTYYTITLEGHEFIAPVGRS